MNGAFPVDSPTEKKFLSLDLRDSLVSMMWTELSRLASLDPRDLVRTIRIASATIQFFVTVNTAVHRFQEIIAGHPYLIEVANVAHDRWRAYIVRIPGVPTALMPFYGVTPDAAADQLRQWLTRAHERALAGARRV